VRKDAAQLHAEPASDECAFSPEQGIANSSPLQGLDCFVVALPGQKAAAGQEKLGEQLCLGRNCSRRTEVPSLPSLSMM